MKCHYEVLQLELDANDDEIRKAYRKLALKWHPDKNLSNSDEAKEQFQLIQQAYEVLSDPQERSWYDRHRDSILKGGLGSDYKDDSLNVYQYYTTSCFKGFGDDEHSFYSVYAEVFNKIAAEDSEFNTDGDSDFEIPVFGNSKSSYEEVVHLFYSYWQSYSTKKTYSWLDKYDIRDAPNRKVVRIMEKENKKIRDKARKERNEEVRALVAFVRKRDKRIQEHTIYLEKKAAENEEKMKELKKKQFIKRKEEINSYVECEWAKFSNFEGELKEIEANLAAEFKDKESISNSSDSEDESNTIPYCLACNKSFKTDKAFINHEKSKKHKENLERLREIMDKDDEINGTALDISELPEEDLINVDDIGQNYRHSSDEEHSTKFKKKKKKKSVRPTENTVSENEEKETWSVPGLNGISDEDQEWGNKTKHKTENKKRSKQSRDNVKNEDSKKYSMQPDKLNEVCHLKCVTCDGHFNSKNELFKHLRSSGHAAPIGEKVAEPVKSSKCKKKKR